MDLRTFITVSVLSLMIADSDQRSNDTSSTPVPTNSSSPHCPCSNATQAATSDPCSVPEPAMVFLTINWTKKCEGDVNLRNVSLNSNSSSPVCHSNTENITSLLSDVCQNRKDCKGSPRWQAGRDTKNGTHISEKGHREVKSSCQILRVKCQVEVLPDLQGQLNTYKVVTALLCLVLVVLLLIRFTKPTVKALQKRLSDRRQNRWIGPTQSHSVSYHRGKTVVKNNDGEKRLSYPALERLTVSDSREPSSNRNSGYTF